MFGFTHQLRITSISGLNVTFRGYTREAFKARNVDPLAPRGENPPGQNYKRFTADMNSRLMDLSQPIVQRALDKSFSFAREVANQAASYFKKRPSKFHKYADMAKIFSRHFKLDDPTETQRAEVERVFEATSDGLSGPVIISDLFAALDGQRGVLVAGAEGQVAMSPEEDRRYMEAVRALDDPTVEETNDLMREHLARADDPDIYIHFNHILTCNVWQMARLIIHEATHKFAYTGDYAYHSDSAAWGNLVGANAIKNADSYAYAAVSVKASSALNPQKIKAKGTSIVSAKQLLTILPDWGKTV